jgi:hypothetical protein
MLEYFEGELICIWFNNLTPVIAKKALEGLRLLHQLGIYHGDIYQSQCTILRNVIVSKEGMSNGLTLNVRGWILRRNGLTRNIRWPCVFGILGTVGFGSRRSLSLPILQAVLICRRYPEALRYAFYGDQLVRRALNMVLLGRAGRAMMYDGEIYHAMKPWIAHIHVM